MNRNLDNKNFSGIVLIIMVLMVSFPGSVLCQRVKEVYPDFKGDYFGQEPPGLSPRLFAPDIISTGMHEHSSVFYTQDMKDVFFTVVGGAPHVILHMKREKGKWIRPAIAPFSGIYSDDFLFFSADGKRLYFESKRPIAGTKKEPEDKYNIWYVEKQDNQWSKPVYDPELSGLDISTACFARNRDLYFGSSKRQGKGRMDIYVARWGKGTYKEVENLGDAVNSPHMEFGVFVDPDEQYLIFTRYTGRMKESGLFISFRNRDGTWGKARNMGPTINKGRAERFPMVSPDGKYLFFNRQYSKYKTRSPQRLTMKELDTRMNRPQYANDCGDVYWVSVDIIRRLKEEKGDVMDVGPESEESNKNEHYAVYQWKKQKITAVGDYFGQEPPGKTPQVFAPGMVATGHDEYGSPALSPDGREIFYTLVHHIHLVLIHMKQDKNNRWSGPETASFSGFYDDCFPFFSNDGKVLYFISRRPLDKKNSQPENNYHTWMVRKHDDQWGEPERFLLFDRYIITSMTEKGTIYCYSEVEGSGYQIYCSRLENGNYMEPEKLGTPFNGENIDAAPCISRDEGFLVFSSYRRPEGRGLYISFLSKNGKWSEPVNLNDKLWKAPFYDFPRISPDGKYLFFLSERWWEKKDYETPLTYSDLVERVNSPENGRLDIYWVDAAILEKEGGAF
jgi:hypothetical protein